MFINHGPILSSPKLGYTQGIPAANTDSRETKGTLGSFYLLSFGSPRGKQRDDRTPVVQIKVV